MRFETPAALALLAAIPLVVLLWRRRAATIVEVASVLPFRAAAGSPAETAPRRRADAVLLLTVAALACVALAAAGPSAAGTDATVLLLVDRSPSTEALDLRGRAVGAVALARARQLLADEAPSARIVEREFDPARLDDEAARLRAEGRAGAVVATDGAFPAMPGFVVVGPERPAGPNAALTSAVLDGDEAVVAVVASGTRTIVAALGDGTVGRRVTVAPDGGVAEVRFPAPRPGSSVRYTLRDGGSLARDDVLDVVRTGGAARVRIETSRPASALERALRAATGDEGSRGSAEIVVRLGGEIRADAAAVLHVAPDTASAGAPISLAADPAATGPADGGDVTGTGPLAAALPQPSTTVAAGRRLVGGEPFLRDARGVLGASAPGLVVLSVDPDSAPTGSSGDPWFAVVVAAALDHLGGGPDRLVATGAVPVAESRLPAAVPPEPDRSAIRACVRSSPDEGGPGALLAALGGAFAAAAAWKGRRR